MRCYQRYAMVMRFGDFECSFGWINARAWSRVIMESWKDGQTPDACKLVIRQKAAETSILFSFLLFTRCKKAPELVWMFVRPSYKCPSWSTVDTFTIIHIRDVNRTCHLPDHDCNSAAILMAAIARIFRTPSAHVRSHCILYDIPKDLSSGP